MQNGEVPPDRDAVLSRRRLLYLSAVVVAGGASAALLPRWPSPSPLWEAAPNGGAAKPRVTPTRDGPPVPVRARPVYRVQDLLPAAVATAVALTVDDGPDPHWTPQVLALLARHRVQATFSLIGRQAHAHPDLARLILAEGHTICNHTMTHPLTFARGTPAEIRRQAEGAQSAIVGATGEAPKLFRAPAGVWSPTVLQTAARNGMVPIDWNVDPRDWSRPGTAHIVRRMLATRPGDIVLCHDGGGNREETVQALGKVLPILLGSGLTFIPL